MHTHSHQPHTNPLFRASSSLSPCPPPTPLALRCRRTRSQYNRTAESTMVSDLRPPRILAGAATADDGREREAAQAEMMRCAKVHFIAAALQRAGAAREGLNEPPWLSASLHR